MKKYILFLGLFLALTQSAHASYVQGGFDPNAIQISTTCNISSGSGSVTAGHMEIFSPLANGNAFASITSTRVPTWTKVGGGGSQNGIWWGIATSSGAESIVFTLMGSTSLASVCAEYTENTINVSAYFGSTTSLSVTTTKPNVTLVCVPYDSHSTAFSAFTQRQTSNSNLILIGDQGQTATGTYPCAVTTSMSIVLLSIYSGAPAATVQRRR
jgi:hypothetical protein